MPPWATALVWVALYVGSALLVPEKNRGRGYVTRLISKYVPPKFLWRPPARAFTARYWVTCAFSQICLYIHITTDQVWPLTFWPIVICLCLDDYFNGGDDGKRRWEGVKNKIKWKMELPPEPIKQEVA